MNEYWERAEGQSPYDVPPDERYYNELFNQPGNAPSRQLGNALTTYTLDGATCSVYKLPDDGISSVRYQTICYMEEDAWDIGHTIGVPSEDAVIERVENLLEAAKLERERIGSY